MCKHPTTLSIAATLVVLAVYRGVTFERTLLGTTLILFGVTIVVSVVSMLLSMTYFTTKGRQDRASADPALIWASAVAPSIVVAGMAVFLPFLRDWPTWTVTIVAVALVLLGWIVRSYRYRRRRAPTR